MTVRNLDPSLDLILSDDPPPFALIYRPSVSGNGTVEVLRGRTTIHRGLADVSSSRDAQGRTGRHHETLLMIPFRQAVEREFTVVDDGADLVAIEVQAHTSVNLIDLLDDLPREEVRVEDGGFETDSAAYVRQVRDIINKEIGRGEGSSFVIKRSFTGQIADYSLRTALSLFRRLLETESGAYWTFLINAGDRVLIGASPERHLSCTNGLAVMNPISGTYRYPPSGPDIDGLLDFLKDRKETDELNMVVDEELKMMTRICDSGAWVTGPFLKEMTHLAHTEYYVQGHTSLSSIDLLRETLFAPTVIGSPLENAFRVIARREKSGRGYYSGCVALIGHDRSGQQTLDSAIVIRTAEIDKKGRIDIGVGATLVRTSDPESEVAETESKVAGILGLLAESKAPKRPTASAAREHGLMARPKVVAALAGRNSHHARFWFVPDAERRSHTAPFHGQQVLVLDGEDGFTAMFAHQLRSLGLEVTVHDVRDETVQAGHLSRYDLVVLGPGPGDPRDEVDPKIARMRDFLRHTRRAGLPLLAVCLGHQVLCAHLGLQVVRLAVTNQGAQCEIDLFGSKQWVGFYNTFVGVSPLDRFEADGLVLEASVDPVTRHVHALRGPGVRSMQFHPESILTRSGIDLLSDCVSSLLPARSLGAQHQ